MVKKSEGGGEEIIQSIADQNTKLKNEKSLKEIEESLIGELFNNAKYYIEIRNVKECEKVLQKIIQLYPSNPIILIIRAQLCSLAGNARGAFYKLNKYIKHVDINTIDPYALEILAYFNLSTENYDVAIKQYSLLLDRSKDRNIRINALLRIAVCKKRIGEIDLAIQILDTLISMPEGYQNYLLLNLEIIHNNILSYRYDEAKIALEKFLEYKNHAGVIRLYSYVLYKLQLFNELKEFASSTSGDDVYLNYLLIRVQLETGEVDNSLEKSFKILADNTNNNFAVLTTWGNYNISVGDFKKALNLYDLALKVNFTYVAASENLKYIKKCMENTPSPKSDEISSIMSRLVDGDPELESLGFFKSYLKEGFHDFVYNKSEFISISPLDIYFKEFN